MTHKGEHVQENELTLQELCSYSRQSTNNVTLFPSLMGFHAAKKICSQLGGELPLPTSEGNLDWALTSQNQLILNSTCAYGYWLPIIRSKTNSSKWINAYEPSKENEVNYLPWHVSQPNGYPIQGQTYTQYFSRNMFYK